MKSINYNAPVKCSKSILINATTEKVWSVLTDINSWADWQNDISKSVMKTELSPGATFSWRSEGANIKSTLHTVVPYIHFGWTGRTFGMFAIHNWTLAKKNQQTEVTVDESMEGFLAGLFKKSFNKNLEKGMIKWLELLRKQCEHN
ncbi:MAG: SRPBCC family protein [Bacteroidetes bacterium]|nr:SRPBCC family protein [Bacteroidota bacterium]